MKRLTLLCLSLILLCSCAQKSVVSGQDDTEDIIYSKYAYVVVGYSGVVDSGWLHTSRAYTDGDYSVNFVGLHVSADYKFLELKYPLFGGVRYQLFRLEPGTYSMVDFYSSHYGGPEADYKYSSVIENSNADSPNSYFLRMNDYAKWENEALKHEDGLIATFEVERGKLNYIGTLHSQFDIPSQTYYLRVENREQEMLEYLRSRNPGIDPEQVLIYTPVRKGLISK